MQKIIKLWTVLQCTRAYFCSTTNNCQFVAICCNLPQFTAIFCNLLQFPAIHHNSTLNHIIVLVRDCFCGLSPCAPFLPVENNHWPNWGAAFSLVPFPPKKKQLFLVSSWVTNDSSRQILLGMGNLQFPWFNQSGSPSVSLSSGTSYQFLCVSGAVTND